MLNVVRKLYVGNLRQRRQSSYQGVMSVQRGGGEEARISKRCKAIKDDDKNLEHAVSRN